jgi:hypothetical protein
LSRRLLHSLRISGSWQVIFEFYFHIFTKFHRQRISPRSLVAIGMCLEGVSN